MADDHLPAAAWAVALAGLPGMGPARLAALLGTGPPEAAWRRVLDGRAASTAAPATVDGPRVRALGATWRRAALDTDVAGGWRRLEASGAVALLRGEPGYPPPLLDDPEAPALLFAAGCAAAPLARPRVAVVGTRRATPYGRAVARELGAGLAAAGACVVSGLATGIDAAAHEGALVAAATAPVAVVGSGLDVPYPRANAGLWRRVAAAGGVLTEAPPGAAPEPWRFPARNRIIAGLAQVVVVVESRRAGGSMHTVAAALARDRTVLAVPGPVHSPASEGTNQLLAEGAAPCRDVEDVLVALGLAAGTGAGRGAGGGAGAPDRPPPDPSGALVLDALGFTPATLEQVAERLGEPLGPVAVQLQRLAATGWVVREGSWWHRLP